MGSAWTLYDKAVANLRTAQILFDHDADDEEQINAMAITFSKPWSWR